MPVSKQQKHSVIPKISKWLAPILYRVGQTFLVPLYFRHIRIQGLENYPAQGPVLIAPTHRARWDALIIPYALGYLATGRHLYFMVSANEMRGVQGWFIRRFGGFAIDPDNPSISAMRTSINLLCQQKALVIFPEGNIFREAQVQTIKPGFARIALQAQQRSPQTSIAILPVNICYQPAVPRWGTDVTVTIGPTLDTLAYIAPPAKEAAERLSADLSQALGRLASPQLAAAMTARDLAIASSPPNPKSTSSV